MLHAIVMAGGSGTRFWPQSRSKMPKQLLKLSGKRTMIQQTFDRCDGLAAAEHSWVVTNALQVDQTRAQLTDMPAENFLVEPMARNTAPCVGLAAIHALHVDPDAIMFIMPADHVISPVEVFQDAARRAVQTVEKDPSRLVLFGISPEFPATGYGYIEKRDELEGGNGVFDVSSFREKPALEVAEQYVDSGRFYWNCGIFCWKASTILEQLKEHEPAMWDGLQKISSAIGSDAYDDVLANEFPKMNSISIDYAVLERATGVTVLEAPYKWDDVGSWLAVPRLNGSDENGNTVSDNVVCLDTNNTIVRTQDDHLVATLGVDDLIIVHTKDATLVARRDDSERIKNILEKLKSEGKDQYL